ncbi:hypothetical protein HYW21_09270 [Candidatus Woesearchaeota archaeon]|nr:hypothetical protein [Candidatus Woesearchaeota archaeon]
MPMMGDAMKKEDKFQDKSLLNEMGLRALQENLLVLKSMKPSLIQLRTSWFVPVYTTLKENFAHPLREHKGKGVKEDIKQFSEAYNALYQTHNIHERLDILTDSLVRLKIASFQQDYATCSRLTRRFTQQKDLRLVDVMEQLETMKKSLGSLEQGCWKLENHFHSIAPLETKLHVGEGTYQKHLHSLRHCHQSYQIHANELGKQFIKLGRQLMSTKPFTQRLA